LIALPSAIWLLQALILSSIKIQLDENEGWNAYWAHHLLDGLPLYPPVGALVSNNYPPLSFVLVAGLARLGVDPWIVGRIVAWLSFLGCAALIFRILYRQRCGTLASMFGVVLFVGFMVTQYGSYVGMYDPQLTAHLVMLLGLSLLLSDDVPGTRATTLAGVAIVTGGFFKHNLVALPVAITLWLALFHRQQLWSWLAGCFASLAFGFVTFTSIFGFDFIRGLLTPRLWTLREGAYHLLQWFGPLELPVLIALAPLLNFRKDPRAAFYALFAAASLGEALVSAMGDRVSYNAMFDTLIATSLGLGYALSMQDREARSPSGIAPSWIALACAAAFLFSTAMVAKKENVGATAWHAYVEHRVSVAERTVALLKSKSGAALCRDWILCYWASKPMTLDIGAYVEAVKTHQRDYSELIRLLNQHEFSVIELGWSPEPLDGGVLEAIDRGYRPLHDLPGVFVLRTDHPTATGR